MKDPEHQSEEDQPIRSGLRRLVLALTLPLLGAALLWWLPGSLTQTRWISIVVIVLALAGWYVWRDED